MLGRTAPFVALHKLFRILATGLKNRITKSATVLAAISTSLKHAIWIIETIDVKTLTLLLLSAAIAATACGQPMSPTQPIQFHTDIGSVAAEGGKVVVRIKGTINVAAGDIVMEATIHQEQFMGVPASLPTTAAAAAARMLNQASEALLSGHEYAQEADGVAVAITQGRTAKVVRLKMKGAGFMQTGTFDFDGDNAAAAARILERTPRIADWLSAKLSVVKS